MENKVVLHRDKQYIESQTTWMRAHAVKLNNIVDRIELIAGITLTDNEKKQVKVNPKAFISEYVMKIAPFKDATIEFNLQALGVPAYTSLLNDLEGVSFTENFDLVKGRFELSKAEIEAITESCTIYATTDAQVKKHDLLIKTIELLEQLVDMDLIYVTHRAIIANCINGVSVGVPEGLSEYKFLFNGKEICDL